MHSYGDLAQNNWQSVDRMSDFIEKIKDLIFNN